MSEEALRKAVDKMLFTYPQFRVRMEWEEDGIHWSTTEGAAEVPIKVYPRETDLSWQDALNKEHAIPLKPSKGPMTRIILVKGDDVSEVIVFCHHSISDGRSLQFALREILLHLGDPKREPSEFVNVPSQTLEMFPEGVSFGRFKTWMVGRINRKWEKEKVTFDEEDLENIWTAFWKDSRYGIEILSFNEEETKKLVEASRENNVTLNSTILIALVRARIEAVGPYEKKANVATAVDSRKRLRVDCSNAVGFYAGGSFLEFDYKSDSSFWDNVRSYHERVQKHLSDSKIFDSVLSHHYIDQTFLDAMLFAYLGKQVEPDQSRYEKISEYAGQESELISKFMKRMAGRAPHVISTNLGRMDWLEQGGGIHVERAFFTPSSGLDMELVVGVATASDRLTITLNYYEGYNDPESVKKIREKAEEILRGLLTG
jgi:NRPS condensation-like uncharacterized protein